MISMGMILLSIMIGVLIGTELRGIFAGAFTAWQLYRPQRPAEKVEKHVPLGPHEQWPEILHWQPGDIFDCVTSRQVREAAPELIALSPEGHAYCWSNCLHDNKVRIRICNLVGRNRSLLTRQIDDAIPETADYMELVKQFNLAFEELRARDKQNGIAA